MALAERSSFEKGYGRAGEALYGRVRRRERPTYSAEGAAADAGADASIRAAAAVARAGAPTASVAQAALTTRDRGGRRRRLAAAADNLDGHLDAAGHARRRRR